jgi:ubiquitin C-terminal hydrolase
VNDRFEFPSELDLTPYLAGTVKRSAAARYAELALTSVPFSLARVCSEPDDPPLYVLHSVLVHSGSVHGGHYYSYVRPVPTQGDVVGA